MNWIPLQTGLVEVSNWISYNNINDWEHWNTGEFKPGDVATHVMVFMVRSLFTSFEFPYAQFATRTATGAEISKMAWEVVRNLEICDLKVMALSCDGASPNRSFFAIHSASSSKGTVPGYKTKNRYSNDERYIYFISDVPHLMKTARNCWSHSFAHGSHRPMWVRLSPISNYSGPLNNNLF